MGRFDAVVKLIVSIRYNQAMVETVPFNWYERGVLTVISTHIIYEFFFLTGLLFLLMNACLFHFLSYGSILPISVPPVQSSTLTIT